MTREEVFAAIQYIKTYRTREKKLHDTAPKGSGSFYATQRCLNYWDIAIRALEQVYDSIDESNRLDENSYDAESVRADIDK